MFLFFFFGFCLIISNFWNGDVYYLFHLFTLRSVKCQQWSALNTKQIGRRRVGSASTVSTTKGRKNEGIGMVADAGGFPSISLRLVRLLRYLGSQTCCLLQHYQYAIVFKYICLVIFSSQFFYFVYLLIYF